MADYPNTLDRGGAVRSTVGRVTSGNVTVVAQAAWARAVSLVSVPASVGETISIAVAGLIEWDASALTSDYLDLVVEAAGPTIARRSSTGTASATGVDRGDPMFYPVTAASVFIRPSAPWRFTVTAGDLQSGNIVFAIWSKGAGGATLYASTDYPLRYDVTVHS
jgi:hypothetical protein